MFQSTKSVQPLPVYVCLMQKVKRLVPMQPTPMLNRPQMQSPAAQHDAMQCSTKTQDVPQMPLELQTMDTCSKNQFNAMQTKTKEI